MEIKIENGWSTKIKEEHEHSKEQEEKNSTLITLLINHVVKLFPLIAPIFKNSAFILIVF